MDECKICLINNTLPGIILKDDICNVCENFQKKINNFNFSELAEKKNLEMLKKKILKNKGNSKYDCLIGVSGGLDSTYAAFLCKKIGLNALLVTIDNGWSDIISHNNLSKLIDYTKFDLHSVHLNWETFKKMQNDLFMKSYPDIEILSDHFIFSNLYSVARKKKINCLINGINFRSEHTNLKDVGWNKRDGSHIQNILGKIKGANELEFFPYYKFLYLSKITKLKEIPILNFINYNPIKAKKELKDKIDYITYENKHYESSFTKFFQGFYLIKKFDFDKRILHLSSDVRNNYYTKEEAIKKIQKPPIPINEEKDLIEFIKKKLGLSENEFNFILKKKKIDSSRYKKSFLIIIIDLSVNIVKFISKLLKGYNLKNEIQLNHYSSISFIEKPKSFGGPGTFQKNLTDELEKKKILVRYKSDNIKTDYFIVIGSSIRNFFWLLRMKFQGSKMIHRIDGNKWQYKYKGNLTVKIKSILQNLLIFLTQFLANKIVYQSEYVRQLWENKLVKNKTVIIYNGSEKNYIYRNFSKDEKPTLISVEGNICSAFNSINLIKCLSDYDYEIYGEIDNNNYINELSYFKNVKIKGVVKRDAIKEILKKNKKYIFVSLEVKTACPNSVIEALNHGIPVIGYDSGSMREIVEENFGKLVKIDQNFNIDRNEVIKKIEIINDNYNSMNQSLKNLNKKFSLDFMTNEYVNEITKT
jgi:N-acetyl sugar amidotransferase